MTIIELKNHKEKNIWNDFEISDPERLLDVFYKALSWNRSNSTYRRYVKSGGNYHFCEARNWTCENCKVELSSVQNLLHTHHKIKSKVTILIKI